MTLLRATSLLLGTAAILGFGLAEAGTVTISPGTQFQTIQGWVAVGGIGSVSPTFQQQQMLTRGVNELGLTTLRLDLPFNGNSATTGHSWCLRIDNTNPSRANWASFDTLSGVQYDTTAADQLMASLVVPFKQLVQAHGDTFTMYTNPSFYNYGSTGPPPAWVQYNTGEYAEYLVSLAEYLNHKYSASPDFMTIINEAGNGNIMTPALEAKIIKAVGPMLKAAGLKTKIQLAECVNATNTLSYAQDPSMDSETWSYVGNISWHDYGTQTSADKASVYSIAQSRGAMTAETETQLTTFATMYDDLVNGGVSYLGQYFLGGSAAGAGIQYYNTGLDGASMTVPPQYWNWHQVMHYVRPGAVRIGATSSDSTVQTMAFQKNGGVVVTLSNQTAPAVAKSMTLSGLPAGTYGLNYSLGGTGASGLTEVGIQTVDASGTLTISVPWNCVTTLYPYAGTNLPPEVYQFAASPTYLKQGSGSSTILTAAATDPEIDALSYAWSVASQPTGANASLVNANTATATANGLTVPGTYIFNIAVSDGHNIANQQVALNVLVGNQPPIISVVQSRSPGAPSPIIPILLTQPQSSVWILDQVASDLEGNTLSYTWSVVSQPVGASVSLATPTAAACVASNLSVVGNYTFQITVSDGTTPVSQDVTVTVDPTNSHAPTIANASGSSVAPGHGHLQATASDADGDYIASWWDITSKPSGSSVTLNDPASPTTDFYVDTPGAYTFQLTTVDRTLYTQSSPISVTISSVPNPAPSMTSGTPPTPIINAAYSFTFQATGYPPPTFSVTSGTLPVGLTLSSTGVLSGTVLQSGPYTFTVDAGNGVNPDATQVVTGNVAPIPAIGIAFSTVGDPGNLNDTTGLGGVAYTYNIGTYDVTASQYTAFLNAVAATDTYGLYNVNMATDLNVATIRQNGTSGSYTYSVIGTGNQPVTFVGWFDAARFVNWIQNGQPIGAETAGTTETGAYTLNGATSGVSVTKNTGAQYWIPTENEWYKAAFYDPTLNGTGGYWLYTTRSNTAPGNIIGASPDQANVYSGGVFSVTQNGTYSNTQFYLTDVGSYSGSASAYGTFDQGGDVLQWNDTINGTTRDIQGGSWPGDANFLKSSYRASFDPTGERQDFGFRIASDPAPTRQTLNFPVIGNRSYPGPTVTLGATATSGLTVSYNIVSGPATLSGNILTLTGTGVVKVQARQAGNVTYTAAVSVAQSFIASGPTQAFAQWEGQPGFFSAQQLGVPATSGPAATPQNDGVPNLVKYLYDINPAQPMTAADRAALPVFASTATGDLTLVFREYASETGITINVQTSSDLQAWTTANEVTVPTAGSYTLQPTGAIDPTTGNPYVEVDFKPASVLPRQFIRLNVTQP